MSKISEEDSWNYFEAPSQPYRSNHATIHRLSSEIDDTDDNLPPPYDEEASDRVSVNPLEKTAHIVVPAQSQSSNCTFKQEKADGTVKLDQPIEIRGENKFERAIRLYGNPLAQDANWSVSDEDYHLSKLPKIDFTVKMTNSFKSISGPAKRDRPGFLRDPKTNRHFNPNARFDTYLIPNKLRCSEFVGTGFSSVYNGNIMGSHDVSAADWRQFLDDIAAAGSSAVGSIPLGLNLSKTGIPLTRAVGKFLQWTREDSAQEVLRIWQRKFFRPRGLEVAVDDRGIEDKVKEHIEHVELAFQSTKYAKRRERKQAKNDMKCQLKAYCNDEKLRSKTYGRVRLMVSPLSSKP